MDSDGAASGNFSSATFLSCDIVSECLSRRALTEGDGVENARHVCVIDATAMRDFIMSEYILKGFYDNERHLKDKNIIVSELSN